jgi:hypothetical protein
MIIQSSKERVIHKRVFFLSKKKVVFEGKKYGGQKLVKGDDGHRL